MIEKKLTLVLESIAIVIIHVLLGAIGFGLYYFLGKNSDIGFWIFVGIFILFRLSYFYYYSRGKKGVEKIANLLVIILFSFVIFSILVYIILAIGQRVGSGKSMFSIQFGQLFSFLFLIMLLMYERNVIKEMTSKRISLFVTVAFFECIFLILLIKIDTNESVIISAFAALLVLMLTPENLEALFNIKVSKYREQQISLIKFHLILLLPFMYILSKKIPLPNEPKIENLETLKIAGLRLIILLIIWGISTIVIYSKKSRQFVQIFFGLPSNQIELNGNWNMVVINKYTEKDLLVRKFLLNIDGRRIKCNETIFLF